jgi:uncharacterized membrane protein
MDRSGVTATVRSMIERMKDSQFLIPALCIAASVALVTATNELDQRGIESPLAIASSVTGTRTLLATIAGSIITVAALVFSLSAVTMQLAATQYSPRVVQGFMRDRRQQAAFGIAIGTFTYALVALATLPAADSGVMRADWTATTSVGLAVLTAVVIVAFIDHVIRKVRVDDTIRRLAEQTEAAFVPRADRPPVADEGWEAVTDEAIAVRSSRAGFVQEIDVDGLVGSLPSGAVARLDVWAGHFVTKGRRVLTVWSSESSQISDVLSFVAVGEQRTIGQDPGFGIRQLVDIALRALSPGVNDPATAADVVRHLTGCLRAAHLTGDANRVFYDELGSRLFAPHAPTVDRLVADAITPIRRAAADHPLVLAAIVDALSGLDDELAAEGHQRSALQREIVLAGERQREVEAADDEWMAQRDDN